VSSKGILVHYTFVSVWFNGVLKFTGTVKIQGFETFSRHKSRGGGYRVSYGSTLKLSGRRCSHWVYVYYVKRIQFQSLGNNGEIEYKIVKF
jgi:hypothetical protein